MDMHQINTVWIDALEFMHLGGWKEDTQFVHVMGSGYLIASGEPGVPVKDAKTDIEIKQAGLYRVWVRTRNWIPKYSPGIFKVMINNCETDRVLGRAPSDEWAWEIAGDVQIDQGICQLSLQDLSGYYGRFAAILLTTDFDYTPPKPVAHIIKERARIKGVSTKPEYVGDFDVIVVGGGPAGVPAAIAAARMGCKTLLLHNRPVLGGNASIEAGVGFNGASSRQPNAREGGIAEEIRRMKEHDKISWTEALEKLVAKEPNLKIFYNWHVVDAEKTQENRISSVVAVNTRTLLYYTCSAKVFIDCSGDGWLGYFAGAKFRYGREALHQYNESMAPMQADTLTMSGCLMGSGLGFKAVDTEKPVSFHAPSWIPELPEGEAFGRVIRGVHGHWWLETPNDYDDLWEGEKVRDELIKIMLAFFNYLKNSWVDRSEAKNYKLAYIPMFNARRESRRLIGDYVLSQNDCTSGTWFDDTIAYAGWPLDLHNPKGIFSGEEGPFFSNAEVPLVHIPYRCLYSVNINNLFFAGRNSSVTHVALGTVRVQNTLATLGQAAGTAAALCVRYQIDPRQIYQNHLKELQQILLKHDQYIPGIRNEDSFDVAKKASISASSENKNELYVPRLGKEGERLSLNVKRAAFLPRHRDAHIHSIFVKLVSERDEEVKVTMHVREEVDPDGYRAKHDLLTTEAIVPPNSESWIEFIVDCDIQVRYLWVWLEKTEGLSWIALDMVPLDWSRAEWDDSSSTWNAVMGQSHSVLLEKPNIQVTDCSAQNIINGYSRIYDAKEYAWVSDPEQLLPQWIELDFKEAVVINTIYLTFDTDMNNPPMLSPAFEYVSMCVKEYDIAVLCNDEWQFVAHVKDNYQRRRIHKFDNMVVEKIRINVLKTGGDKSARIFEVRAYKE